jgi:predicted lipoprotein with Yx(FWY)xxD motif
MRRIHLLLAFLLASLAGASTAASAQAPSSTAHAARAAKVQVRSSKLGKILVNASGFTLYRFTSDPRNKDTCLMVSECSQTWPPYTTTGRPIAGSGAKASLLSTIRLPNGRKQVTYAGHPLYLYAPASERGETGYVGQMSFGGNWDAVSPAGKLVK